MASMRFASRFVWRGIITLTLLLIFFNEILIYYINQSSWLPIDCKMENCTRIMFIADPQLLGKTYEKSFIVKPFAIYDSDRYLQQTFERAVAFTQPHIICFLGDLLDEGNIASPEEYQSYVQRFRNIYHTKEHIRHIHISGDNDIGGENGEYISNANVRRFEASFMQEDLFDYDGRLRFFKINRMLLDFTNPDRANNADRLRIALSHSPILIGGGSLLRDVIRQLDPHVLFSGHWHESRIFVHPSTKVVNFYEHAVRHFDLKQLKEQDHSYLEIMVPTASYRMGKTNIGIGYGVIENYNLRYTVLWLPNRFVGLLTYAFWIVFSMCGLIVFKMMTRCPFRVAKRHATYNRVSSSAQF